MREIEEIKADYVKCKDCIHENICKFADEKVSIGTKVKETLHNCKDFKDKDKFIEIPCKIGDFVYLIDIDRDLNKPPLCITAFRFVGFDREGYMEVGCIKYRISDIGKTVFLTKAEAEKALKEREEK